MSSNGKKPNKDWENLTAHLSAQPKVWLDECHSAEHITSYYRVETIVLTSPLKTKIKKFATRHKLTLATLLHGAWGLLLNRYSNADDIMYGSGHTHINLSNNSHTLPHSLWPIRSVIKENESVLANLQILNLTLRNNKQEQNAGKEIDKLQNLFSYLLLFVSKKQKAVNNKECLLDPDAYPLALIIQNQTKLQLELFYNNTHFLAKDARQLAHHYRIILEKMLRAPKQDVKKLSLLTNYEKSDKLVKTIYKDAILPSTIKPNNILSIAIKKPRAILLTSVTGFLNIHLLRDLLIKTEATLYCLADQSSLAKARKKLQTIIDDYELADEISLDHHRIALISGDITQKLFGMTPEQYNKLASTIDVIYHCDDELNSQASYTELRSQHVTGTLEVMKFAMKHWDKPIHYISSLVAAHKQNEQGEYVEDFPNDEFSALTTDYASAKWVAERLLTQAKALGLPVSIYRVGHILGQTITGITPFKSALLDLVKRCIQLGMAPEWNFTIKLLPVDYVSECIITLALQKPGKNTVFHIDHPRGILWGDLMAWLNDYGYRIKYCSADEWDKRVKQNHLRDAFLKKHFMNLLQTEKTTEALNELNLFYPVIDNELLTTYMKYLRRSGFLPAMQPSV